MSTLVMAGRDPLAVTIDSWLKGLRMECYRRNLETYSSFQSLLSIKDADLKKLGIQNARDRLTMINSLSTFTKKPLEGFGSRTINNLTQSSDNSKSLLKKGTPMKKLKGLLAGGSAANQRKGRKTNDVLISSPRIVATEETDGAKNRVEEFSQSMPSSNRISMSLEDLLKAAESQQRHTVENDYVPDPQGSPQFHHAPLQRAYTMVEQRRTPKADEQVTHVSPTRPLTVNYSEYPVPYIRSIPTVQQTKDDEFDHLSPKETTEDGNFQFEEGVDGGSSKHLSVVSMESGLGMTYENDDNFNASLALEEQPWFHGKLRRGEAERLLDEDGDFLIHENITSDGAFTLSLMWEGRCYHKVINCDEVVMKGLGGGVTIGYKYQFENGAFDSIPELLHNHLRYQIPISRDLEAVIRHPICKPGSKGSTCSNDHANKTVHNRTLPKNFGCSTRRNVISPDLSSLGLTTNRRDTLRNTRSASFSPADSPRSSPQREIGRLAGSRSNCSSSGNLLVTRESQDEDEASNVTLGSMYNDAPISPTERITPSSPITQDEQTNKPRMIDPYNTYDFPVPSANIMRPRAKTESLRYHLSTSTLSDSSDYQHPRPMDPDDYEEMRSVSVFDTLPSSPNPSPKVSPTLLHRVVPNVSSENDQYALIVPAAARTYNPTGPQPGVKYAEITFKRANTMSNEHLRNSSPLVRNAQPRVTYVTPKMIREEIANSTYSHPFSKPDPLEKIPNVSNLDSSVVKRRTLPRQSSMDLLRSSRPVSIISRNVKSPQTIQEIPPFLKDFTNDEIAMHLTKADAVCFLLTPRPSESPDLWKNRVQEVVADGVYVGLEILASSSGVKLWKKLFHRHLSLSQLVILCIIQVPEAIERAKTLKKWIELCQLLQSGSYGNLFAFMAVMKALESPQVSDLTRTWELLQNHFSDAYDLYENQLKGMISALTQGASVYAIEGLTVPAIQHLKKLYSENDSMTSSHDVHVILEDFTTRVTGLDGLRSIIRHTADLSTNARKRLSSYSFDTLLFDFFMQDVARMHLQNMGTSSEEPLERYRRFNIVLDSLVDKIECP